MEKLEDADERLTCEVLAATYTIACFGLRDISLRATSSLLNKFSSQQ
jgi:hypothetical protein